MVLNSTLPTKVEDWFRASVARDPSDPTRPDAIWLAVAFDIGVLIGETMIGRRPELEWAMVTRPKRDLSYQRSVVTGFSVPGMHVDPVWQVSSLAFRVIEGWDEPGTFLKMLWNAKATENWSPRQVFGQ